MSEIPLVKHWDQWRQHTAAIWLRKDGARVWTLAGVEFRPSEKAWRADNADGDALRSRGWKKTRSFKTPEAAMNAVDKEFPIKEPRDV